MRSEVGLDVGVCVCVCAHMHVFVFPLYPFFLRMKMCKDSQDTRN